MNKLIYKLILLITTVFFVGALISMNAGYAWGNIWYQAKIDHLENFYQATPSTYFFGSSRIYRQIDPKVFDSIYSHQTNIKTTSYNLGAPATFSPQSYYLYEQFLASPLKKSTSLVFLELTAIDLIPEQQLGQARVTYWQNFSTTAFALKAINAEVNLRESKKRKAYAHYIRSYIENAMGHQYVKKMIFGNALANETLIGTDSTGYLSLEQQLELTTHNITKTDLLERNRTLQSAPDLLDKRSQKVRNIINKEDVVYNREHLNRIQELIERSEENNVHLVFVVAPRVANEQVVALAREIPEKHLIDLSDPDKYPTLYSLHNSFDVGHLNDKGAAFFSELLAKSYVALTSDIVKI